MQWPNASAGVFGNQLIGMKRARSPILSKKRVMWKDLKEKENHNPRRRSTGKCSQLCRLLEVLK